MGTDFRRFETVLDPIRVHPRNPWLKQLDPMKMLKNPKVARTIAGLVGDGELSCGP